MCTVSSTCPNRTCQRIPSSLKVCSNIPPNHTQLPHFLCSRYSSPGYSQEALRNSRPSQRRARVHRHPRAHPPKHRREHEQPSQMVEHFHLGRCRWRVRLSGLVAETILRGEAGRVKVGFQTKCTELSMGGAKGIYVTIRKSECIFKIYVKPRLYNCESLSYSHLEAFDVSCLRLARGRCHIECVSSLHNLVCSRSWP